MKELHLDFDKPSTDKDKLRDILISFGIAFGFGVPAMYGLQFLIRLTQSPDPFNTILLNGLVPFVFGFALFVYLELKELNDPEFWFQEKANTE